MKSELNTLISRITKECERLTLRNIEVYDVQNLSPVTDAVLVATADHVLQLDAARRSMSFIAKEEGFPVRNPTEDYSEGWLVLDCTDLIIHILVESKRSFYDLDGLMTSIQQSRDLNHDSQFQEQQEELTETQLEEILDQLTPDEVEQFLNDVEESQENQ
ncbi:MAG: ribosome silencing factor [Brevinemataceae bacterium]